MYARSEKILMHVRRAAKDEVITCASPGSLMRQETCIVCIGGSSSELVDIEEVKTKMHLLGLAQ